jgi:hypothetical protein
MPRKPNVFTGMARLQTSQSTARTAANLNHVSQTQNEKMQAYRLFLLRQAVIAEQRKAFIERIRMRRNEIRKQNSLALIMRLKQYSKLPLYKNCTFNIPIWLNQLDKEVLPMTKID